MADPATLTRVSVFIGWSGPRSRAVALALHDWLPQVIQAVTPWVSEVMDRGAQWFATIGGHLREAHYGLLCVTPENATEPWVLFEAGALAIHTNERLTCPYLLDMTPAALEGPLGQLQAARADQVGTLQVVETINRLLDDATRLPSDRLRRVFERWWPDLEQRLAEARRVPPAAVSPPERTTDSKLDEVLEILRAVQRNAVRPDIPKPIDTRERRAATAALKSDLRNLVTAQEAYFADHVEYAGKLSDLSYATSPGVVIRKLATTEDGWYAIAHHEMTGIVCGIYIGTSEEFAAFREGEPFLIATPW